MTSYLDLIQQLFRVNLFGGVKLGLQNALQLQQLLHFPDRSFISIHVAGTNGKGSVSTKIAYAFEQAGYKVGLFTSPHISTFRERIRINSTMIPEERVESLLSLLFKMVEKAQLPATFFELTTFLAFLYFAQEKIDLAVIETGLGGRLDATNVIHPCLSIITSISLDHTDILGHDLESIALEKAGIIKEKIPVIIGPCVPLAPIQTIALQKHSPCFQVEHPPSLFEEENCEIARTALNHLSSRFYLPSEAIEQGLQRKPACRFEVLQGPPLIILDVAHNPNGFHSLFQTIRRYYPHARLRLLVGFSKNKDFKECLNIMTTYGKHIHLVEADNGKGVPLKELYSYLETLSLDPSCLFTHTSIAQGVQHAQQEALQQDQIVVICGSFFIMGQVRKALGFIEPQDEMDLNEQRLPFPR